MAFVPRPEFMEQLEATWDHHRFAICHYVVFPNTVFNCNPGHVQLFTPIPIDVDRTRFKCWELIHPGDRTDPDYAAYYDHTMAHWATLKGVVGEDIAIYEQLQRTKRSSGYTEHILSSARVQDRDVPRDDGAQDQRLTHAGAGHADGGSTAITRRSTAGAHPTRRARQDPARRRARALRPMPHHPPGFAACSSRAPRLPPAR